MKKKGSAMSIMEALLESAQSRDASKSSKIKSPPPPLIRSNMSPIEHFTNNPLYKEIKIRLTRRLMEGEWKSGEAIPSESKLAQHFKVSVGTIRKAIDELVAEKVLIRQQGRGTFVATHTPDRMMFYFFHIIGRDGTRTLPTSRMISFNTTQADAEIAAKLAIEPGAAVHIISNVLKLSGVPILHDDIVLPVEKFPDLTGDIFQNREGTIYNLYQKRYGMNVIRTSERARAAICDEESARVLRIEPGAPILEVRRVAFTYSDIPVEYRYSRVNTEDHEYYSDIGNNDSLR